MRLRSAVVVLAFVATNLVLLAPAGAHDGEASDSPSMQEKQEAWEAVAARSQVGQGVSEGFAPCIRGMAARTYPCDGIDMLAHVSPADLGLSFVNDMWGWTDPRTRRDYALVGGTEGTVIVDISFAFRPRVVGILPAHMLDPQRPFWRDLKVFDNHMYVVSEQVGHGVQVFDLTEVRGVQGPVTFAETAHYDGISTAHNVAINTDTGFLYVVGAEDGAGTPACGGGLHMVDINDPAAPTFAGCFSDHGYIHDTQCVIYGGPDPDHQGSEICFNSNAADDGNFLSIVDVSDKSAPVALARMDYANDGYSHQAWLTPDQQFLLHGDELDELDHGIGTTTRVWDVRDLDNPVMTLAFENATTSIDHNIYTEGRVAYASNYTSGLRVYDTSRVAVPELSEKAFFDVYPENDNASFEGGTWSNYPYFRQKRIVAVSSIDRGLFILRPRISVTGH
jgi:choice-of-anchor B domain-containing protein